MKHWLFAFVVLAFLVLALTLPVGVPAAPPVHNAVPAATPAPHAAATAAAVPEPHPEIHDAIESLRRAKAHLEHANHDFGGHRAEALRATDEATRQLEVCLRYDRD